MTKSNQQHSVPLQVPAPSDARQRSTRWALVLELLLILLVVRSFRIEERRGLFELLLFALIGLSLYWRVTPRWKPFCFLTLSLLSMPLAFAMPHVAGSGWMEALAVGLPQSAWVIGPGVGLFGLCHLPFSFWWRVATIAVAAAGLVYWRADAISPFWAVLGSMFMFRLWIYLRETRRERSPASWSSRITYFFLLPNAFFPFFPIVDYRRFRDGFVDDRDGAVAQRGVAWILRGIIHLLLYRAVKIYLLPAPIDLIDVEYIALFLVTNYTLYLQISGHFHIITGLLHLFGFDLPRTHDRYFLASSFSDIWRRINIYWKDFLTEHVFYPAFFSLRRLPKPAAIVAAVGVTFVATWILHSWQAFWLLGDFPVATRDAALWLAAGTLVAISSLWQYQAAIQGVRKPVEVTPASALLQSLKVAGTFATVSFFWACWTVPKFPQLIYGVAMSGGITSRGIATVAGTILAVVTGGTILQLVTARLRVRGIEPSLPLERSPMLCAGAMGALVIIAVPQMHSMLGSTFSIQIARLQSDPPPGPDAIDGYYGLLAEANLQSEPLLSGVNEPGHVGASYGEISQESNDVIGSVLKPGFTPNVYGVSFDVNRWGMRDDDVSRPKHRDTYRIALLGSSTTMGHGVAQDEDFESLLEQKLAIVAADNGSRLEILNFGGPGYYALHSAAILRDKAFVFTPDAAYYVAHQGEYYGLPKHLARCLQTKVSLPYACLQEIAVKAGVSPATSWGSTEILLKPYASEIATCIYRGMAEDCKREGVLPVWIYVPIPGVAGIDIDEKLLKDSARRAGFVVLDVSGWEAGHTARDVKFAEEDYHANGLGHRLIAAKIFEVLQQHPEVFPFSVEGLAQASKGRL